MTTLTPDEMRGLPAIPMTWLRSMSARELNGDAPLPPPRRPSDLPLLLCYGNIGRIDCVVNHSTLGLGG
jgi:hypothetical protein